MNKYFKDVNTLEELRKQYKNLLKMHHPDNGGSEDTTKEINTEYERLFKILKDKHDSRQQDNANCYESEYSKNMYDWENDKAIRETLEKIINFDDIEIEIIGAWIWVSGNTYNYRKQFKELGFKYAGKKKAWYFHTEAFRKKSHKSLSMDDIRDYYGSTKVQHGQRILLEAQSLDIDFRVQPIMGYAFLYAVSVGDSVIKRIEMKP